MSIVCPGIIVSNNSSDPGAFDIGGVVSPPSAGLVSNELLNGDITIHHGVMHSVTHGGLIWPGINSSFYNRIVIEPAVVDVGNILSDRTAFVYIWNGFFHGVAVEAESSENAEGLSMNLPSALPYAAKPLELITNQLDISLRGPAVIDATFSWIIDGVSYTMFVIGKRLQMWTVPPDWSQPVIERLSWATNILRAYSGKEQRRRTRITPRRQIEYKFTALREDAQRIDSLLWGWQSRIYGVPVWTDRVALTAIAATGSALLHVPGTDGYSFSSGSLVAVIGPSRAYEVATISEVLFDSISLTQPLRNDWPKGSAVYPVITGFLPPALPMSRVSDMALQGTLPFSASPDVNDSYIPDAVAAVTYLGLEVITQQPNWQQRIPFTNEFNYKIVDGNVGPMALVTTEDYARVMRGYSWLLTSRAAIKAFREFLGRMQGQFKTCWVPTWTEDFTPATTVTSGATSISVVRTGFTALVGADGNRGHVMIRTRDGQRYFRSIESVGVNGDFDVIVIDTPLGVEYAPNEFIAINLMLHSRLATDSINIEWHSLTVATVETTFMLVPL